MSYVDEVIDLVVKKNPAWVFFTFTKVRYL